jgi:cobalt-zinc-cadmium efflux system membrane fusion protein
MHDALPDVLAEETHHAMSIVPFPSQSLRWMSRTAGLLAQHMPQRGSISQGLAWVPNVLVLAGLAAIGYWGQVHHWTVPSFADLTGTGPAAMTASLAGPADMAAATTGEPDSPGAADLVCLPSMEAVDRCGVAVGTASVGPVREFITAHGVVASDRSRMAELASPVAGTVWRVNKSVGQTVREGEALALISSATVGQAKTEFLQSALDLSIAAKRLERLQTVQDAVRHREIWAAEADVREGRLRLLNAKQALVNLGLPIDYQPGAEISDEELVARVQFLGIPEAVRRELDPQTVTANLIAVKAPFDGVVINRECVTGEVVEPARPQFVIADVSRMWIGFDVAEEAAARLAVGQPAVFTLQGQAGQLECRLSWIGTAIDEKTRTIRVRAELENPIVSTGRPGYDGHRLLKANSFGLGGICVRQEAAAVMLPRQAVQWDGNRSVVFRPLDDGLSFEAVDVQVGATQGQRVEITSGISPGDPIVLAGGHVLKSELALHRQAQ